MTANCQLRTANYEWIFRATDAERQARQLSDNSSSKDDNPAAVLAVIARQRAKAYTSAPGKGSNRMELKSRVANDIEDRNRGRSFAIGTLLWETSTASRFHVWE